MERKFWRERWEKKQIAFHLDKANAMLAKQRACGRTGSKSLCAALWQELRYTSVVSTRSQGRRR